MIITNIQHFCLHDGDGIRTTVFMKGCTLKCPWCANIENIDKNIQYFMDHNKCCKESCQNVLKCDKSRLQDLECLYGAIDKYGYEITSDNLYNELVKDIDFYCNGGGVTFSGGEPLLQIVELEDVLKKLKKNNINICFETALFVPNDYLKIAIKYANTFIVDVKILEEERCKKILGGDISLFYKNIKLLFENNINVVFRVPLSYEYTLCNENIFKIKKFISEFKPNRVEIFSLHCLAEKKYETLGYKFKKIKSISEEDIENIKNEIETLGVKTKILKI